MFERHRRESAPPPQLNCTPKVGHLSDLWGFDMPVKLKYDQRFKLKLIKEYLSGDLGRKAVAHKYSVPDSTMKGWVLGYVHHGKKALAPKPARGYSARFKLTVLKQMWADDLSQLQAAALFDIRSPGRIGDWVEQYRNGGLVALEPVRPGPKKMRKDPNDPSNLPLAGEGLTREQLLRQNLELRAEVAYLKKLNALVRANQSAAPKKRK